MKLLLIKNVSGHPIPRIEDEKNGVNPPTYNREPYRWDIDEVKACREAEGAHLLNKYGNHGLELVQQIGDSEKIDPGWILGTAKALDSFGATGGSSPESRGKSKK